MTQSLNMHCKYFLLILVVLFSFSPLQSFASVSISEVMYDPAGSDDGHEWIEVYNSGASFDLSKWKLFEGGTNHGISAYAGGSTLVTGGYAVLVDNPAKFLADWPSFSGQIFDTVFSGGLNNTNGEALILRNDSLADVDSVTYNPTLGASGDGNSLQKVGSSFTALTPTPGSASGGSSDTSDGQNTQSENSNSSTTSSTSSTAGGSYSIESKMSVSAGGDRVVIASAGTVFEGRVQGLKGETITNARLVWNFGNGESREGRSVLYAFPYPGRYVVILDASSEIYSATTRFTVTVVPAQVSVTEVNSDFVEITNSSNIELNLGLWQLTADGQIFRFPANTILFPHESVAISNIATGLVPSSPQAVTLLYPNGTLAAAYGTGLIVARKTAGGTKSQKQQEEPSTSAVQSSGAVRMSNPSSNLLAAPITALSSTSMPEVASFGMLPWIVGLLAVIGIGIGAVLLIRGSKGTTTGYTIIEEE